MMEKEPLSFKNNTCRIDVKVAGMDYMATGFIYPNNPHYAYDYVLTAKHLFQESEEKPKFSNLSDLIISWVTTDDKLKPIRIEDKELSKEVHFFEGDLAIIKIPKDSQRHAKRIVVKNLSDIPNSSLLLSDSFMKAHQQESTNLEYYLKDKKRGIFRLNYVYDIGNYCGASGSGIYCSNAPYLVGVLAGYRITGFEQSEINLTHVDWREINNILSKKGWAYLNLGHEKGTMVTFERDVLDVKDIIINDAHLDMEKALRRLQNDLTDDWYFDSLHYVDLCNTDFVLDYFSSRVNREQYKPERMEVFYLPKKSFVLRKAMVGTFVDRLVYTAVVNQLGPVIDNHLSNYVYSARYNAESDPDSLIVNGVDQWTKMNYLINSWIEGATDYGCIVKLDLLNYYDTINKHKLVRMLREVANSENEKACVSLLQIYFNKISRQEEVHGIPQNCDASSLLATFYVSHVDEIIQVKAEHYCRFMDDMYFMAKDIYEARELLQSIEKHLRDIDLSLNAQKVDFYRITVLEEKNKLVQQLSLYDHNKTKIKHLVKSDVKGRRMNGIALLLDQLDLAMTKVDKEKEKEQERAFKFSIHALASYKLELKSYWDEFAKRLLRLTINQVDAPTHTPLICRLVAHLNKTRNINDIVKEIEALVLREKGSIYEWQAYHLWMLLAYLGYKTPRLVQYAAQEIEKNDATKTVEVAAIFIYMVTIKPEYSRILLHRLRDGQLHGNFQKRSALISIRSLDDNVMDDEVNSNLCKTLLNCHAYLNKHKTKKLVFFHNISSHPLEQNESVLFPELYSGL